LIPPRFALRTALGVLACCARRAPLFSPLRPGFSAAPAAGFDACLRVDA
jgi:hypothetical protein